MAWFANYGSEGHREAGLNWDEDSAVMSRRYKQDWSFMTTGISDIPIDRLYCETRSVIALDKDYWNRHLNMVSTIQTLYDDTDAADIIHFYGLNRSRPALSIRHLFLSNRGRARMVSKERKLAKRTHKLATANKPLTKYCALGKHNPRQIIHVNRRTKGLPSKAHCLR